MVKRVPRHYRDRQRRAIYHIPQFRLRPKRSPLTRIACCPSLLWSFYIVTAMPPRSGPAPPPLAKIRPHDAALSWAVAESRHLRQNLTSDSSDIAQRFVSYESGCAATKVVADHQREGLAADTTPSTRRYLVNAINTVQIARIARAETHADEFNAITQALCPDRGIGPPQVDLRARDTSNLVQQSSLDTSMSNGLNPPQKLNSPRRPETPRRLDLPIGSLPHRMRTRSASPPRLSGTSLPPSPPSISAVDRNRKRVLDRQSQARVRNRAKANRIITAQVASYFVNGDPQSGEEQRIFRDVLGIFLGQGYSGDREVDAGELARKYGELQAAEEGDV